MSDIVLKQFRLTTLMEAIKIAELRWLEARAMKLNAATTIERDYCQIGRKFDKTFLPATNSFHKRADVGEDIEVRSTVYLNGALIVRDNDDPERRYVLVICDPMKGFMIRGWAYGHEAKQPQWLQAGSGRPAYWYRGPLRPFDGMTIERPEAIEAALEAINQ
jgi:hypothetical protein